MPIPADISELRTRFKRDQESVFRQHRERAGVAEPLVAPLAAEAQTSEEPEPKKAKAKKKKAEED
jgi:hypothetical protein